ncbi:unnamed protein product, partial [Rotaria magnacalcarata]
FTALDCRAFEVVSGEGFMKLEQSIFDASRHTSNSSSVKITHLIPSPTTISRNIDRLYEEKKVQLTRLPYCGLALRHVTQDFNLQNFILGCILYDTQSQSAHNVRSFVDSQLKSYGLTLNESIFVVSDSENKMRAAFKEKCTRIEVDKRRISFDKAQSLFEHVKKMVTHDTRFNGAFYMLEVFLDVYDELAGIINNVFMANLAAIDKELLEELCTFLKIFDQVIDALSEEEKPTMHKVIPVRQLLLNHCDLKYEDSGELKELNFSLVSERIKCVGILQDQHYVSTLLHPSLKYFEIDPNEKSKAIALVRQELLKRSSLGL